LLTWSACGRVSRNPSRRIAAPDNARRVTADDLEVFSSSAPGRAAASGGRRRLPSGVSEGGFRDTGTGPRARRWWLSGFAWFFGALALIGPASEFGVYRSWILGVPFVAIVLTVVAWTTYGVLRTGILIEPGLVTNRRMLRTSRVPAGDIVRFEPPPPYGTIRRTGIRIVLVNGKVLSATAFAKGQLDKDSVGTVECAELNAWLSAQARVVRPLH
jgi:hypothetical protein